MKNIEDIKQYNLDSSKEKLLDAMQQSENVSPTEKRAWRLDYLSSLLNLKLQKELSDQQIEQQKELLESQNVFNNQLLVDNEKLVKQTRHLVYATIALAVIAFGSVFIQLLFLARELNC